MTQDEIITEFMKGCLNTQILGEHPSECEECLSAAVHAMVCYGHMDAATARNLLRATAVSE